MYRAIASDEVTGVHTFVFFFPPGDNKRQNFIKSQRRSDRPIVLQQLVSRKGNTSCVRVWAGSAWRSTAQHMTYTSWPVDGAFPAAINATFRPGGFLMNPIIKMPEVTDEGAFYHNEHVGGKKKKKKNTTVPTIE